MLIRYAKDAAARALRRLLAPMRQDIGELRKELRSMSSQLEGLEGRLGALDEKATRADRVSTQLRLTLRLNDKHRDTLARLDAMVADGSVLGHVRHAIANTRLDLDPYPHMVVNDLFPPAFYKILRDAIPPQPFFMDRDPIKQNLKTPMDLGPALSVRTLDYLDDVIAREAIRPAVMEKFHEPLLSLYDTLFGPDFRARADLLPQAPSGGRLMLRRPGYFLAPHRDPKRAMLTCLLYLAGARDDEAYGTQIFRVADDREATFTHTYYPEEHGSRCELVKTVPYRPNSMLVFLNSTGAHGAAIPPVAPATLERFTYQFYIGPGAETLNDLVKELPPERQAKWTSPKASGHAAM